MGYMTSQFVNKGMGIRSRAYRLLRVQVEVKPLKRSELLTLRELGEAVQLRARQDSGEYQDLKLSGSEAASVAVAAVSNCSLSVRVDIAKAALATLSNEELLDVLAVDMGRRSAPHSKRRV